MTALLRLLTTLLEHLLALPLRVAQRALVVTVLNPRLGPLRHVFTAALAYVAFALALVYLVAPLRGVIGAQTIANKLHYDSQRWLATAIYDGKGDFVGVFDPRLDSQRDVNFTGEAIDIGEYVANPDHKSIPVREVPEHYWQCLVHHEDRHAGTWLNPYGIDLLGVLKIPLSTIRRSIATKRPSLGVGGSTLPMQIARVIYKTPPNASEGGFGKLTRKLSEWWLAPVIYHELTRGGDDTLLRQWAANHIWLAQRTGGASLHGVELTSRIVFGKEAKDLTIAEQFVLASAVNKPIILLTGSDRLNAVRLDRWKYIIEVRARTCAERLIGDPALQKEVAFALFEMAGGPPDPKVKPRLQRTLEQFAGSHAERARANPIARANLLIPRARFALREEMKQTWGHGWRDHVRSVTTTLDVAENLAFQRRAKAVLISIDADHRGRLAAGYTLDPAKAGADLRIPNIVVAAATVDGRIVRYFDVDELSTYTGSPSARDGRSGHYDPAREGRRIASTGKMLVAMALANEGRDSLLTSWTDALAPERGLDGCRRGDKPLVRERSATVAFACSLNRPIEWRAARLGQERIRRLIDGFGFTMPPAPSDAAATPPSTAAVRGLIAGSPQRVHHMSAVVLAALTGRGARPVKPPTLVRAYELFDRAGARDAARASSRAIVPDMVIRRSGHAMLRGLLSAPLCHRVGKRPEGTLKSLSKWCAAERKGVRLHFAKTGTDTTSDPSATVDVWVSGGIAFDNGAAYSYVVMIGTGSTAEPWARNLHASQVAAPLVAALLEDLEQHAKHHPPQRLRAPAGVHAAQPGGRPPDQGAPKAPVAGRPAGHEHDGGA